MSGVKRATRVAGRLQEELSAALRELRDPRLEGVLVSRVELTDDLQLARVYVRRALGGDADAIKAALKGLSAAAGRLRWSDAGDVLWLRADGWRRWASLSLGQSAASPQALEK